MCTRAAWPGRSLEMDDNLEFKFYSVKINRARRLLLCKALRCTWCLPPLDSKLGMPCMMTWWRNSGLLLILICPESKPLKYSTYLRKVTVGGKSRHDHVTLNWSMCPNILGHNPVCITTHMNQQIGALVLKMKLSPVVQESTSHSINTLNWSGKGFQQPPAVY